MTRIRFILSILLCTFTVLFCGINIYRVKSNTSEEALNTFTEVSSTKYWQDNLYECLNKRNDIINNVLNRNYKSKKGYIEDLNKIECSPLLEGDTALLNYMYKEIDNFSTRVSDIYIDYSQIREFSEDSVVVAAKTRFVTNNNTNRYNYEARFKKVKDHWLLSELKFAE